MRSLRVFTVAVSLGAATFTAFTAQAESWDMSIAWPVGNFHTQNAIAFADAVRERTQGRVDITVHAGGALGLRGPETLRAVRDGIVPIAEMFLAQQAGDAPILSLETMPFLVRSPEELETLYEFSMPVIEETLAGYGQKLLYIVPWPSQTIFTAEPVASLDDLAGVSIRTTDRNNGEMMEALGMAPVTMPFSDLVPALASGAVQGVQTSAPTAVDISLWQFADNALPTNHTWASNMVTVNLDRWNALSEEDRAAVEEVAAQMQPTFWENSIAADTSGRETLVANGMVYATLSPELLAQMEAATRPIWASFVERVPEAGPIIDAYLAAVGRE